MKGCKQNETIKSGKIEKAIEIINEHPGNIGVSLLQRYLRVGVIESNKILEALEKCWCN